MMDRLLMSRLAVVDCTDAILNAFAVKATKYLSPKEVVKATLRGKRRKSDRTVEMVVTVGKPNCAERAFIKIALGTGEPFPVKKLQLKWPKSAKRGVTR